MVSSVPPNSRYPACLFSGHVFGVPDFSCVCRSSSYLCTAQPNMPAGIYDM
ncbi:hypothetical protein B0H19DRAFT_1182603, partial [Mycena capillaripes]